MSGFLAATFCGPKHAEFAPISLTTSSWKCYSTSIPPPAPPSPLVLHHRPSFAGVDDGKVFRDTRFLSE